MIRTLHRLASMRITVPALVVFAALAMAGRVWPSLPPAWLALPTLVLACNLLAALARHPHLRAQRALALFHWALIGVCLLVALSVLGRFEGEVEVVEGAAFDPDAVRVTEIGPLANRRVDGIGFEQGDLAVDYLPGLRRQDTATSVRVGGEARTVGDREALDAGGYRLSPTSNKGFAVLLAWRGANGETQRGAIHLPSYPVYEWRQENTWRTPAGEDVVVTFRPRERAPIDAAWTLSRARAVGTVGIRTADGDRVVAIDGARPDRDATTQTPAGAAGATPDTGSDRGAATAMHPPGATIALRGGTLTVEDVRLWMGYRIERDPALPWLFVVAALGITALGWHFVATGPASTRRESDVVPLTDPAHALDRG